MSFQPSDLGTIATLVLLEGLLSADNALVLALLVRHLPEKEQQRALTYGFVGAFVLRALGIAVASVLITLWWVCGLGALYLIGMTLKHFLHKRHADEEATGEEGTAAKTRAGASFWKTVGMVGFTDVVFAVDSILVAVALVNNPNKIWLVYLGGFLGIVLLRVAAGFLVGLIRKYPALDNVAYGLVGWAGVKLAFTAGHLLSDSPLGRQYGIHVGGMSPWVFWPVFALILVAGITTAVRHKRNADDDADQRSADQALQDLQESGFVPGGARVYHAPPATAATTVPPADPSARTTTPTQ